MNIVGVRGNAKTWVSLTCWRSRQPFGVGIPSSLLKEDGSMMDIIPSADVRVRKGAVLAGKLTGIAPLTRNNKTFESKKWHDCRADTAGTVECVAVR